MTKSATVATIHTIGLDIAKTSFSVHGFDAGGNTVVTRDLKRGQVLAWLAKLRPCFVGLEACASAHYGITVPVHSTRMRARCSPDPSSPESAEARLAAPFESPGRWLACG